MSRRTLGAAFTASQTSFTVWAPEHARAELVIEGLGVFPMQSLREGYFTTTVANVDDGSRYGFQIDGGPRQPDLASRWQDAEAENWSYVVANDFLWTDQSWSGLNRFNQVIYQLHIGAFTAAGTWRAARDRLDHLKALGVTIIQLMPVGSFKGSFGWGYDTIFPYAPYAPYGSPNDMRAFVDAAHALGIGVIHDVVYNHVGIGDSYRAYSAHFFADHHENEWGASLNFDGPHCGPVRDFVTDNAAYWIREFHLDGLRLDATQALFDTSDEHIIAAITRSARDAGHAAGRSIYVLAENQPQDRRLITAVSDGGYGLDALASDDFHHAAHVAITGHNDFYYRDYLGTPQELVSALKFGFLYQGQRSDMSGKPYGTYNLDTGNERVVNFLENHDQVANSARGFRLSTLASPARVRAMTALLLLAPQTPCLFQGQEFGVRNPFLYFRGLQGADALAVVEGRSKSLSYFPNLEDVVMQQRLLAPHATETFARSKLDWNKIDTQAPVLALHKDLIALRRHCAAFSQDGTRRVDGAVIGESALLLRYFADEPDDERLLMLNLGRDLPIGVLAEPLFAPPRDRKWVLEWSSDHPDYDGAGRRPLDTDSFWLLPADTTIVLRGEVRS